MKPKLNLTEIPERDRLQTPPSALVPLVSHAYLHPEWAIWEPAAGEALLSDALVEAGWGCIASDILYHESLDFFTYVPERWDCIITNPPYSIKYPWMERCLELGKPWALLLPLETLGAARAQAVFKKCDMELIVLSRRVNFKTPNKGWEGSAAQFPVAWFTSGLNIGKQITYADYVP